MSDSEIARASQRAARLYSRSQPLQSAYLAGARVALAGNPRDLCPYRNRAGFGSAFRSAWLAGHSSLSFDDE